MGKASARRRSAALLVGVGLIVLVWLAAGLRTLDPAREFGVLESRALAGRSFTVRGRWAVVPPGLLRLSRYPRDAVELALPGAGEAQLRAQDGSRYGFRGWITLRVRPEAWPAVHRAAAGRGIEGALLDAVRSAASGWIRPSRREGLGPAAREDFERRLGAALGERGLDLRRLDLDSVDYLTVAPGNRTPASEDARLLVIGLDGADWAVLDPLMERGKLPNLRSLVERGTRARLLSIQPLLSPVVWTSVATGVEPTRHGILDFLVSDPAGGGPMPVTSAQRREPPLWALLSRAGVPVGVVGWWATWPAEPVRGYLVADRVAFQLFGYRTDPEDARGKTWPPELYAEIRSRIVAPSSVGWDQVRSYLSGPRDRPEQFDPDERRMLDELRTVLASGETYLGIARHLARAHPPRLEVVYFEGTDTAAHLFMPYRPPSLPRVDPRRQASFADVVDRYYETIDGFIGELLAGRGDEWTVMVLSDHGFATDATRPHSTDPRVGHGLAADWHRRFGVLVLSGRHVRPGVRLDEAGIYDVAPTILALFDQPIPRSWPGQVLGGALTESFLEAHPVRYSLDEPEGEERAGPDPGADPAASDLLEKLRSLGYVSGGGGGAETARNNAGLSLLAEGRWSEAEREFREALTAAPDSPLLRSNLALALRLQGRLEEAAPLFESVLGEPALLRAAGNQLARLRLDQGRLVEAEALARRVLVREPDAADVHDTLGRVLEARGDLDGAEASYAHAAELDPQSAEPRNNLGSLYKLRGDARKAETWLLRAIEADPHSMGAYNNLALVYQERGEMTRAIELYRRALARAPDDAVVLSNLASLHYAVGERAEARRLWTRATAAKPDYPSPWNNLAGLEIGEGRYAEAEPLLRRALELDSAYGDARMNLALVLGARGEIDAARTELRRAADDPRVGGEAWLRLGRLELERGRADPAAEALERAVAAGPPRAEPLNLLGEAYRRGGHARRAIEVWRRSLALDPAQPAVRQALAGVESVVPE